MKTDHYIYETDRTTGAWVKHRVRFHTARSGLGYTITARAPSTGDRVGVRRRRFVGPGAFRDTKADLAVLLQRALDGVVYLEGERCKTI